MAEHSLRCSVNAPGFIRYSGEQAEENTEPLTDERRLTHNAFRLSKNGGKTVLQRPIPSTSITVLRFRSKYPKTSRRIEELTRHDDMASQLPSCPVPTKSALQKESILHDSDSSKKNPFRSG